MSVDVTDGRLHKHKPAEGRAVCKKEHKALHLLGLSLCRIRPSDRLYGAGRLAFDQFQPVDEVLIAVGR